MALLRLQNEADCLTSQLTKQSLKHQPSPPPPNRSYPYRASGLVPGSIVPTGEGKGDCERVCPENVFEVKRIDEQDYRSLGVLHRFKVRVHGFKVRLHAER
jgi:hypothetical protein